MSDHEDESDSLQTIIEDTPVCSLEPKQFFVAWHGVITLVFNGWPEPIDTMKEIISKKMQICNENFGSKFPKVTIGVIKDNVEMTKEMLKDVRQLCDKHSKKIDQNQSLKMEKLNIVLYHNRCQESIICEKIVALNKNHEFRGRPRQLKLELEEKDDTKYLEYSNRYSHYQTPTVGSSIVYRLDAKNLPQYITDFQKELNQTGYYQCFEDQSLHVTVRGLTVEPPKKAKPAPQKQPTK